MALAFKANEVLTVEELGELIYTLTAPPVLVLVLLVEELVVVVVPDALIAISL